MTHNTPSSRDELRKRIILKVGYVRFEQGLEAWQRLEADLLELFDIELKQARMSELIKLQNMITTGQMPVKNHQQVFQYLENQRAELSKGEKDV